MTMIALGMIAKCAQMTIVRIVDAHTPIAAYLPSGILSKLSALWSTTKYDVSCGLMAGLVCFLIPTTVGSIVFSPVRPEVSGIVFIAAIGFCKVLIAA